MEEVDWVINRLELLPSACWDLSQRFHSGFWTGLGDWQPLVSLNPWEQLVPKSFEIHDINTFERWSRFSACIENSVALAI